MALGPKNWNPYSESIFPCADPEITDVNCEDCPIYPNCAKELNAETPQDQVPFPGANLGKNLNFIAGRVLLNIGINKYRINRNGNQQFLGF